MENSYYIASCSFGKDSLATILLALENREPLDEVIYSEVMFDHSRNISGELPEHINWVYSVAIPKLESFGLKVTVLRDKYDYLHYFHKVFKRGKRVGEIYGFPLGGLCKMNILKLRPIRNYLKSIDKDIITYVGIAIDEPSRLVKMHKSKNKISLLERYNYAEDMVYYLPFTKQILVVVVGFVLIVGCLSFVICVIITLFYGISC